MNHNRTGSIIIFLLISMSLFILFCMNVLFKSSLMQQSLRSRIAYEKSTQLCYGLARYGARIVMNESDNNVCLCIDPWPPLDIPSTDRYKGILEITRPDKQLGTPTEAMRKLGKSRIQATLYNNNIKKSCVQLYCKLTGPGQWLIYI